MDGQISIFDGFIKNTEDKNTLEIVKCKFMDSEFTDAIELFSGYKYLYAVTFSYGLSFIDKIAEMFERIEIIIGAEFIPKYDLKEVMAFQTRSLETIRRHTNLINRVKKEEISFRLAHEMLVHSKIYILMNDDGTSRVITGSVNFSGKSFSGDQRECIQVFDNDSAALDFYMNEYELIRDFSTDDVVVDSLYINKSEDENIEHIPVVREVMAKEAGIIVDNDLVDKEAIEFITDVTSLSKKYEKVMPKLDKEGSKIFIKPVKVRELVKNYKKAQAEEKEKRKEYPLFLIDYDNSSFNLNGKPISIIENEEKIRADLQGLNDFYAGYEGFIGDSANIKDAQYVYFKFMNYMFLAPFISKLRFTAAKLDYSLTLFPLYAVITGPKSAGKSEFVDTIQHIMYGKRLGSYHPEAWTKTRINGLLHEAAGVPLHVEDIDRDRFNANCGEIVKYDRNLIDDRCYNHPVIVMTSNNIEVIKPEYAKRIYMSTVNLTQDNVSAAYKKKKVAEIRKRMGTAFYHEYLRRIMPEFLNMIDKMENYDPTGGEEWQPDIFALSSKIILEIYSEYMDEVPDYIRIVTYEDYFGYTNNVVNEIREKIIFEWQHNKRAFVVNKKTKTVEYIAGERSFEADKICNALPEFLQAKKSGTKVVMKLKEAEEFFGIKFKGRLF